MLSADTKTLLRQALSDELPAAGQKILQSASDGLDRSRAWFISGTRTIRRDQRTPYVLGAVGVAALAGVAWFAWQKLSDGCCGHCDEDGIAVEED